MTLALPFFYFPVSLFGRFLVFSSKCCFFFHIVLLLTSACPGVTVTLITPTLCDLPHADSPQECHSRKRLNAKPLCTSTTETPETSVLCNVMCLFLSTRKRALRLVLFYCTRQNPGSQRMDSWCVNQNRTCCMLGKKHVMTQTSSGERTSTQDQQWFCNTAIRIYELYNFLWKKKVGAL